MIQIKWEIWLQIQEGPVVLHSGHCSFSLDECLFATLSSYCTVRNEDQMGTKFAE